MYLGLHIHSEHTLVFHIRIDFITANDDDQTYKSNLLRKTNSKKKNINLRVNKCLGIWHTFQKRAENF